MEIYSTLFNQQLGQSNEPIHAVFDFGQDFTADGSHDIKVTLSLNAAANSGTEDMLGVAFHVAGEAVNGLEIPLNLIQRSQQGNAGQTLSTFTPAVVMGANKVSDANGFINPGFSTSAPGSAEAYDVGIKFSDGGLSEGIVQTASFVMSKPGANLDKSLLEDTQWLVGLESTNGGSESAKMGGLSAQFLVERLHHLQFMVQRLHLQIQTSRSTH